jgi:hypothetical protein
VRRDKSQIGNIQIPRRPLGDPYYSLEAAPGPLHPHRKDLASIQAFPIEINSYVPRRIALSVRETIFHVYPFAHDEVQSAVLNLPFLLVREIVRIEPLAGYFL